VPTETNKETKMNLLEHLQPLPTELLNAMAKGEVDTQAIAAQLMAGRGLDRDGKWVGFEKAKEVWRV
jgi:hypothetical protein